MAAAGYGPWTRQVFGTLVDWLEERRAAGDPRSRVFFDTSAVILEKESEGVPPTTPEEASALGADLRRAGLGRIVLGSDSPVFDPRRTLALLAERAGLTPRELATIAANRPLDPELETAGASGGGQPSGSPRPPTADGAAHICRNRCR